MISSLGQTVAPAPMGAALVGSELRTAREALGWALPDVAAWLKIRQAHLEAVEDGRLADLPGTPYALGFLRQYAGALGLDGEALARRLRANVAEVNRKAELDFPEPLPRRGVPAGAVLLLGLLLSAGAYIGWYRSNPSGQIAADTVPPVPARLAALSGDATQPAISPQVASVLPSAAEADLPAAAVVSAPPAVPNAPLAVPPVPAPSVPPSQAAAAVMPPAIPAAQPAPAQIVLHATADSWVQVRNAASNTVILDRVLHAGETWPVPAEPDLVLTTGNAGGTTLLVDGAPVPSLGKAGSVRRDVRLNANELKNPVQTIPAAELR